jgi:hypothetical protein
VGEREEEEGEGERKVRADANENCADMCSGEYRFELIKKQTFMD